MSVLIACSGLTVNSLLFVGLSFGFGVCRLVVWFEAGRDEEPIEFVNLFSEFAVSPFEMSPTISSSSDLQLAVSFPAFALCWFKKFE